MRSWHLEDADELAARYKYTFYKPSETVIRQIAIGEVVKLIFRFESDDPEAPSAERMWVLVDEISGDRFRGRLDNDPMYIKDLKHDDQVEFRSCHIISTEHDDDNNIVERYASRCFVTKGVLNEGKPVGYLYREDPDQDDDSGWRIMANDETEDYVNAAENIAYVSLGVVLNEDDSFVALLESPIGSAFVRDAGSGRFNPSLIAD